MTLCCINLHQYDAAVNFASEVLKFDSVNVKAIFRRAVACRHLERVDLAQKFDQAITDLEKAVELDADHEQAKDELALVKRLARLKPKPTSSLALGMGRSLLHGSSDREKLTGARGSLVALGRTVVDILGSLIGKQWYTEDDYEYY